MIDATPWLRLYARRRLAALAREDPVQTQQATLLSLVRRAAPTRFGRDHGFDRIRSVADYQAHVPLRHYGDFWTEYWRDRFPRLEGATWPGPIPYLAFTSGTSSGSSKYIPVSRDMIKADRRAALDVLVYHLAHCPASRILGGKSFMLGGSTALVQVARGIKQGDLSGIAANEVPLLARPYTFPPRKAALEADWEKKMEHLTCLAAGQDIRSISGTPNWVLTFLERLGQPVATLFPKLELYIHGGVSFRPYQERFARILAGSRAETREVYPASEGFIAIADQGNGQGLRPLLDNGLFLEFVPRDELAAARPTRHWIAQVQPGVDYAVVLTSCAGLFSYVLGDTVRFAGPRLLVTGRLGYQLNVFGEHLSGEQMEDAIMCAAAAAGLSVAEFSAGARFPETSPRGHHVFVVEFTQAPLPQALPAFARSLDCALQAGSLDYRERREADVGLNAPEVMAVPPGFFAAWMKQRGRLGGQNKVPRVIANEGLLESLLHAAQDSSLAQ